MRAIRKQFRNFNRLGIDERRAMLNQMNTEVSLPIQLSDDVANQMIENFTMNYQLPLGIANGFVINDQEYLIPMVTEEPSVIAAAQAGARRLGNITTSIEHQELIGQVIIRSLTDVSQAVEMINQHQEELLAVAKSFSQSMVQRGGGPRRLWPTIKAADDDFFLVVYLSFDSKDAMGANALNTVLEGITPKITELTNGEPLMSILSNYSEEAVVRARVELPLIELHRNEQRALTMAQRIEAASVYSQLDVYRGTTHNKGIMNGIDAVAVATGNDWRAIEAGAHAYASKTGTYQPLSQWSLNDDQSVLTGTIELPIQVGTVGGTLSVHPVAQWSLTLLDNPNSQQLAQIMAAVGLAQNFSALRALVTDGIQKGHMGLQARSLALQVGATVDEVPLVVRRLRQVATMNQSTAKDILERIRKE